MYVQGPHHKILIGWFVSFTCNKKNCYVSTITLSNNVCVYWCRKARCEMCLLLSVVFYSFSFLTPFEHVQLGLSINIVALSVLYFFFFISIFINNNNLHTLEYVIYYGHILSLAVFNYNCFHLWYGYGTSWFCSTAR